MPPEINKNKNRKIVIKLRAVKIKGPTRAESSLIEDGLLLWTIWPTKADKDITNYPGILPINLQPA
jgi:hypothetical protein